MASAAQTGGDATKAQRYGTAAGSIATQLITLEKDVEGLKVTVLESRGPYQQANKRSRPLRRPGEVDGEEQAALEARPGPDAGAAQQGDGIADR